jgi:alpha-L-fucosidase
MKLGALACLLALAGCATPERAARVAEPAPLAPVPSARQLAWQQLEFCAFVHFNMDTFTDREWGEGTESPAQFAPTALDCRQWARVAKEAGMKEIVLTAKHHDGFCLWPSKLSEHDVEASAWRDGHGDVLRELSDACRENGLKLGLYLSPWDRNSQLYGTGERYNDYFAGQLEEVLTSYGEISEVWFDGACGEGPNGKKQVYDWPRFIGVVRKHQPNAVIFSDVGPDIRWVGNENGIAGETCWSMISPEGYEPGAKAPPTKELNEGREDGTRWIAAECDVSIRPGWYYHASEDGRVKSLDELLEIYYGSVGRNGSLLLNLPVDRRGLVHENDVARLRELRRALDRLFADDLARGCVARATNVRGNDERFAAARAVDGDVKTYWATDDGVTSASVTLAFDHPTFVDHAVLTEEIALGQRVERFAISAEVDGAWNEVARGTTIGHKRILRFDSVEATAVKLEILAARACPTIASFELYRELHARRVSSL